jgi:polysaccharide export outer membrane protein
MWQKEVLSILRLVAVTALLAMVALAQQTTTTGAPTVAELRPAERSNPMPSEQRYRIGPGDLIDIRVFGHPEMGIETRVDPTGHIRVPFLDEMQAACLTEAQLSKMIEERFRKYLRAPQVAVLVKDFQSQPVSVIGAVQHPGRFLLQRRVRLLEMLGYAGGQSMGAGSTVHLIRSKDYDFCALNAESKTLAQPAPIPVPDPVAVAASATKAVGKPGEDEKLFDGQFISINLHDLLGGAVESNLFVEPGDIVSVPEADQVYLTGGVMRPGPIQLRQATTLSLALGMAGGFFPDAAKKRIRLLRQVPGVTTRQEMVLDYEAIEKRKADDVVLQPNDLIEVPSSTAKSMGRGLLGLIVPTLGQMPLRVVRPY